MSEVFVHRLRALNGAAKSQLVAGLNNTTHSALVRSAFDLPTAQRSAIESAVKETFATETQVRFETAPELVGGIELSSHGQKLAWSIADYLATLEKSAGELLHPDSVAAGDSAPASRVATAKSPVAEQEHEPVPSAPKADH